MKHSSSRLICQEINNSTPRQLFLCSRKGYSPKDLSARRETLVHDQQQKKEERGRVLRFRFKLHLLKHVATYSARTYANKTK